MRLIAPVDWLKINCAATSAAIEDFMNGTVLKKLRRKGIVVGLSGGIDSSVVAALSVRAVGRERVFGLLMPEHDSSDDSLRLGWLVADWLGIEAMVEDIGPVLDALGCYRRRDAAIRTLIAEFGPECRCKLALPDFASGARYSCYSLVVETPSGETIRKRMTAPAYMAVVAATNFKQRTRKMLEYYHADRLQYAVAGTPNRLEYDQGFFVKNGDGSADLKPIAHLYKSQVYQLAEYLDLPQEIRSRQPTTDTFSMPQTQEEFYFSVPLELFDCCLYGKNNALPVDAVAAATSLTPAQVKQIYDTIDTRRRATSYLHQAPLLAESLPEIQPETIAASHHAR